MRESLDTTVKGTLCQLKRRLTLLVSKLVHHPSFYAIDNGHDLCIENGAPRVSSATRTCGIRVWQALPPYPVHVENGNEILQHGFRVYDVVVLAKCASLTAHAVNRGRLRSDFATRNAAHELLESCRGACV